MSNTTYHQEELTSNLCVDIVEAIADCEGTSPAQLSPPLHSVIDPDALNSLFQPTDSEDNHREGEVCFPYCGYNVHVDSDGNILIESLEEEENNYS